MSSKNVALQRQSKVALRHIVSPELEQQSRILMPSGRALGSQDMLGMQRTIGNQVGDRYNFNPGAKDISTGIPDADNGVFEITGLAHQYMNYGTTHRTIEWLGGASKTTVTDSPSGRQRMPSDNRRLRNRI